MSDLHTIARDISHALRPLVPVPLRQKANPNRRGARDGAELARGTAAPVPAEPSKPAPTRRDLSRIIDTGAAGGAVVLTMRPRARHTPAQQAARSAEAEAILADAVKAAPEGTPIRVAMRGRVIASTVPAEVVSVAPKRVKHPG